LLMKRATEDASSMRTTPSSPSPFAAEVPSKSGSCPKNTKQISATLQRPRKGSRLRAAPCPGKAASQAQRSRLQLRHQHLGPFQGTGTPTSLVFADQTPSHDHGRLRDRLRIQHQPVGAGR
jgi:hypothetical protein